MRSVVWFKIVGLFVMGALMSSSVYAQNDAALSNTANTAPNDSSLAGTNQTDTSKVGRFGSFKGVHPSLRHDYAVEKHKNNNRVPLAYQYIRPKDAVWGKRVWEEIDTRQKMNKVFVYDGYNADGQSLMLINILVDAILKGKIVAFKGVDDQFTTPLSIDEVKRQLSGKPDTILVPDPITGDMQQKIISNEFNPSTVKTYRLKEDWVFDRQTSRMYCRIIGVAPLQNKLDPQTGELRGRMPLFWLYYPDLRPILAKYKVYNPNNFYQNITWTDLFDMRRFSGHIVKESNVGSQTIKQQIPGDSQEAGIRRLLRGREIHNKIFNFEQSLWVY